MPDELNEILADPFANRPDPQSVAYPRLESVSGPQEGLFIALRKGEEVIGRSRRHAEIALEDTSVSRRHVKVSVEGSRILIQDLGSRNGTLVNGVRLGPEEETEIRHLDLVKIGIYVFRLALKPVTEVELAKNAEGLKAFDAAPPVPAPGAEPEPLAPPQSAEPEPSPAEETNREELVFAGEAAPAVDEPMNRRIRNLFLVICAVGILIGTAIFLNPLRSKTKEAYSPPPPAPEAPVAEPSSPAPSPPALPPDSPGSPPQALRSFPAFLDLKSTPTTARIYFNDRVLGSTPVKAPVELKTGEDYTVTAEFELKDIHDRYQQKLSFKADPRQEVVPLSFDADIGTVKVMRLPRGVDFYLEGYYAYDKYRANPVRLDNIRYGQPIYVPFGQYVVELRERVRVGSSQTYVKEIRYRRDFAIDANRREVELSINDRDLQFCPARVQSVPSGATLYLDGSILGTTPYSGELPLGKHELKLTHEGFFDHVEALDMRMNTPFEATIDLKTSKSGDLIQKAVEYQRSGDYASAISQLVDALKYDASAREKAKIHFLLGDSYFMMGNAEQATLQFEQAKSHPEFYNQAILGLARAAYKRGSLAQSLTYTVEVLLNAKDGEPLQGEAQALFKQLSPLKSVLYVSTDPKGATVTLNGREIAQKTPLILSELAFGNYRVEIAKQGFKPEQVRKNLKISEFSPVIVKLKPEGI